MEHDPLCPSLSCIDRTCEDCCRCDLITKVREDTLAAAVQRVEALRFGSEEIYEIADMYHGAIAAIKGGRP